MEESSFAGGSGLSPEEQAAADEQAKAEAAAADEANEAARAEAEAQANAENQGAAEGEGEGSDEAGSDERNPAVDQAPVAAEAQEAIIGDPGLRDEQQPQQEAGSPSNVNTPNRTSAPPPEAQSGVPLPEDRAAGVEPGE